MWMSPTLWLICQFVMLYRAVTCRWAGAQERMFWTWDRKALWIGLPQHSNMPREAEFLEDLLDVTGVQAEHAVMWTAEAAKEKMSEGFARSSGEPYEGTRNFVVVVYETSEAAKKAEMKFKQVARQRESQ